MFNTRIMFWKRLKTALDRAKLEFGMSQEAVAAAVRKSSGNGKFSQQAISKLIKTKAEGSKYTIYIARSCRVSPLWLALGEGQMEEEKELTEEARRVAQDIDAMSSEHRQYLHGYIKANKSQKSH